MNPLLQGQNGLTQREYWNAAEELKKLISQITLSEELLFGWLNGKNCRVNPCLQLTAGSI